jgi:hypothetical protein
MLYTLYHATDPAVAPAIMATGFVADDVWLANCPWKIGVKGEELIELTFDFEQDVLSFPPDSDGFHHVVLSADFVTTKALSNRIVSGDEKKRLIEKFGPPGDWPRGR